MNVLLAFDDNPTNLISYSIGSSTSADWNTKTIDITSHSGKKLVMIAFELSSGVTVNPYLINLGKIKVFNNPALGIHNNDFEKFSISPNPNKGTFTINMKSRSGKNIAIDVYDIRGAKLYSKLFESSLHFSNEVHLKNVSSGIYFVNVSDGENQEVRKIIIN